MNEPMKIIMIGGDQNLRNKMRDLLRNVREGEIVVIEDPIEKEDLIEKSSLFEKVTVEEPFVIIEKQSWKRGKKSYFGKG